MDEEYYNWIHSMFSCPQCGGETYRLHEGVCADCWEDNQRRLDLHNAEHNRWAKMSDAERSVEIKRAYR